MDAAVAKGPLLAVKNIEVIYDHVILVLRGVSLEVPQGASSRFSAATARARARHSSPSRRCSPPSAAP